MKFKCWEVIFKGGVNYNLDNDTSVLVYSVIIVNMLQIEMGFLMVGHTHEDIDQSFSCLLRLLRNR
jgi:hypothetical protein